MRWPRCEFLSSRCICRISTRAKRSGGNPIFPTWPQESSVVWAVAATSWRCRRFCTPTEPAESTRSMDLRKLKKLIELVQESGIAELEITEGEEKVKIVLGGHMQRE